MGGVAPVLSNMITSKLNLKVHWAVSDYLQRSARHISSQVDLDQAYAVGKSAVEFATAGEKSKLRPRSVLLSAINSIPEVNS